MTTVNEPFLREVLAWIELHPERWDQSVYRSLCGTTYCLAGWAYVLGTGEETWPDGAEFGIEETAADLLGLDLAQAAELFFFIGIEEGDRRRPPPTGDVRRVVRQGGGVDRGQVHAGSGRGMTTITGVNVDAIRAVVAMIELNPQRWNQTVLMTWRPDGNHAYCFAGWTLVLAGHTPESLQQLRSFRAPAQELLGLTRDQAHDLFFYFPPGATVAELKDRITSVTGVTFG